MMDMDCRKPKTKVGYRPWETQEKGRMKTFNKTGIPSVIHTTTANQYGNIDGVVLCGSVDCRIVHILPLEYDGNIFDSGVLISVCGKKPHNGVINPRLGRNKIVAVCATCRKIISGMKKGVLIINQGFEYVN
jgi:hypothetical protein